MRPVLIYAVELAVGGDTVALGATASTALLLTIHLLHRTKEIDERRDEATKFEIELAFAREAKSLADVDALIVREQAALDREAAALEREQAALAALARERQARRTPRKRTE